MKQITLKSAAKYTDETPAEMAKTFEDYGYTFAGVHHVKKMLGVDVHDIILVTDGETEAAVEILEVVCGQHGKQAAIGWTEGGCHNMTCGCTIYID